MAIPNNNDILRRLRGETSKPTTQAESTIRRVKGESMFSKSPIDKAFEKAKSLFSGVSGKEFIKAVPEELSRQVGQPQLRAYSSVAPLFSLGTVKPLKPETEFQKELFGTDQPLSITRAGRELRGGNLAKESTGIMKGVDVGLGLFAGLADAVPQGKAVKTEVKTGIKTAKELAENRTLQVKAAKAFDGFKDITTKVIDRLKGKTNVSKQYIQDLSKGQDIRQAERDLILRVLEEFDDSPISKAKASGQSFDEWAAGYEKQNPITRGNGDLIKITDKATGKSKEMVVVSTKEDGSLVATGKDVYFPTKVSSNKFDIERLGRKEKLPDGGYTFGELDRIDEARSQLKAEWDKSGGQIDIPTFANKIKQELLPLEVKTASENAFGSVGQYKYEQISLPKDLRGKVKNYDERIYESPIKTSAGDVHFGANTNNYFAHTRIEDMADGTTRRVIEAQSDLFQKGRLENEIPTRKVARTPEQKAQYDEAVKKLESDEFDTLPIEERSRVQNIIQDLGIGRDEIIANKNRAKEISKLEPYRNTWHERIIREEIKKAATDGKTKLQFPTGETAMKIEGLGARTAFHETFMNGRRGVDPDTLKVGQEVFQAGQDDAWIITDVLGDGKFKAVPKNTYDAIQYNLKNGVDALNDVNAYKETFDISGKVDTNNPIYKFYEDTVGKFLKNKYGAQLVTDKQGVKWWEVGVNSRLADQPVEAFGGFAGFQEDENGNLKFDPVKGGIGVLGLGIAKKAGGFDPKKVPAAEALENAYTKVITNKDEALKAFSTYDHYSDVLDETRFIKVQEMQVMRDQLAQAVSEHPGRELSKYANKKTGELPEVLGSIDMSGKGAKSKFGIKGDDIATELGFQDSEQARESYQKYLSLKERLKAMEEALKEERPYLRERKALERTLNKHVVKASEDLPRLGTLVKDNIDVDDISGFMGGARDIYRNFKAVFGKHYDEVKTAILDPLDTAKKLHIEEQEKLIKELNDNVVKKWGIDKGSKLSQWIMDYGEGKTVAEELVRSLGKDDANKVINSAKWFRSKYDAMLDEVNAIRKLIYPTNPEKIIPKRPDYFRHFFEMTEGFGALKNIFESPAGIAPSLAGLSDFTAPRSKFLSFAQKRLGIKTERDAVGGFLNYIQSFAYAKHIDPHIGKIRRFRKDLIKGLEKQESLDPKRLNNFLEFLSDYANDLAGKTNSADRAIQKYIPGGRKLFNAITWLNRRIKANVILGNASSSIAQAFNIPQGIASAKQYSIPGAMRTLGGVTQTNTPMSNSTFIKERYFKGYDQFDKGILKNTKKFAVWMTTVLDEVGTKFIWNSHYEKAVAEGMSDPIKYADDMARSLVAGRGVGEVPLLQKSKVFQVFAPFQLEVGNLWHVMGDFVKEKDFTAIATLFVANYLMNRVAERIRGTDVTFDPIQATIEGVRILKDEDDIGQGLMKGGGRIAGEVLSNVPLGQTLAGFVPQYGMKIGDFEVPTRKDLFGTEGDPTRFGTGILPVKGLQDPVYKVLPGFAGGQVKKTIEGLRAYFRGAMEDKSGKKTYDVARNLPNLIRSGVFGAYSTPEAREYFKRNDTAEARLIRDIKEKAKEKTDQTMEDAENMYRDMKKLPKEEAKEAFDNLAKENPDIAKAISKIAKEEKRGLTQTERQILSAGVSNGARAEIIYKLLQKEKSREGKAKLWSDLSKKKIITKEVAKQIKSKLNNEKTFLKKDFSENSIDPYEDYLKMSNFSPKEKGQTFIQKAPKTSINDYIQNIKDKIPFFESRMGKALKEEALSSYPFDEGIKDVLRNKSFIKDTSPLIDRALGISKDNNKIKIGPPSIKYGGSSTEGRLADYIPFGRKILESDFSDKELSFIGKTLTTVIGPNRIEIKVPDTITVAHELIHAVIDKRGMKRTPDDFNNTWTKVSKTDKRLQIVDEILKKSDLYEGIDEFALANERLAYLGAMLGSKGISAFPKELQEDYQGIFNGGSK